MDTDRQLYEEAATGWQRGLYEDVKHTFRAPTVNWIFRTLIENEPEFTRYLWGQIEPIYRTRAFGRLSVAYRSTIYDELSVEDTVPRYRLDQLNVSPAEFAEIKGQIATFDVVAPRLATLFEVVDRSLNGGDVGTDPDPTRAACEPLPAWLDRDRGRAVTMIDAEAVPEELEETIESIRAYHGFEGGLPSIYRTMAQWPGYLKPMWEDVRTELESDAFELAVEASARLIEEYVESVPYAPQLTPDALERQGFEGSTIRDLRELFETFNRGPIEKVVPALPVFAYTVGAEGRRRLE